MDRSSRRGRPNGAMALGSPPLVTMQHSKTSSAACDLNETIDENDAELLLAADQKVTSKKAQSKQQQKAAAGNQKGKRKRKPNGEDDAHDHDKENNHALPPKHLPRKKRRALAPLGGPPAPPAEPPVAQDTNPNSARDSPPIFAFKQAKTALKARKIRKEKQHTQEGNQKRLDDLAAYYASVDSEKLTYM